MKTSKICLTVLFGFSSEKKKISLVIVFFKVLNSGIFLEHFR